MMMMTLNDQDGSDREVNIQHNASLTRVIVVRFLLDGGRMPQGSKFNDHVRLNVTTFKSSNYVINRGYLESSFAGTARSLKLHQVMASSQPGITASCKL